MRVCLSELIYDLYTLHYRIRSGPLLVHAQYVADLACLTLEKVGDVNACTLSTALLKNI